jgi:hypothetical protein
VNRAVQSGASPPSCSLGRQSRLQTSVGVVGGEEMASGDPSSARHAHGPPQIHRPRTIT